MQAATQIGDDGDTQLAKRTARNGTHPGNPAIGGEVEKARRGVALGELPLISL